MNRISMCALALGLGLLLTRLGYSQPIDAGNVTIDFDRTTFSFVGNDGFSTFDIWPESVSITPIADGIDLSFENQMRVSDFALGESDSQEAVEATFNAGFSFLPNGGRSITGYQVTLYGDYDTERPGDATAAVFGVGTLFFSSGSNQPFEFTLETAGPIAPQLNGYVSAVGMVDWLDVVVGTELVYVGSTFEPDPACVEPDPSTCPLIEIPLYEEQDIIMQQADLGGATINLRGIRLQAVTVPEPTSSLLALGLLVPLHRRRAQSCLR